MAGQNQKPGTNLQRFPSQFSISKALLKWGENTDLKMGLRYEHTDTRLDSGAAVVIVDRNYGSWFPSFFLARKISEKQNVNFSYAKLLGHRLLEGCGQFETRLGNEFLGKNGANCA